MRYLDEDPAADAEAEEYERMESRAAVDAEMAEMTAAGNAIARAERRGICTHGSVVGYSGGPRSSQQEGLKAGWLRCTKGTGGCAAEFNGDEEWYAAMDAAVEGV